MLNLLRTAHQTIVRHPKLRQLAAGHHDLETWQRFIAERFAAASSFESLLVAAIIANFQAGHQRLGVVLSQNLMDELGYQSGRFVPTQAHRTWRRWLVAALNVPRIATPWAVAYNQALESLIKTGTGLELAGALLVLESTISGEFRQILTGLEHDRPDQFQLLPTDSRQIRQRKDRARHHLVDHIHHDALDHTPNLKKALTELTTNSTNQQEIEQGMEAMITMRVEFYDNL